jgi:hypothetical protein
MIKETVQYFGTTRVLVSMPEFDGSQSCVGLTDWFYSDDIDEIPEEERAGHGRRSSARYAQAKRVCKTCPFIQECLTYGLAHEMYGVWGGLSGKERIVKRAQMGWTLTSPDEFHNVFATHRNNTPEGE